MTESQKTRFVDGLRVTPLHLNHTQSTAEQAVRDLRGVVGFGKIGYGFRLLLSEDGAGVTLSPGLGFAPGGLRARARRGRRADDSRGRRAVLGRTARREPRRAERQARRRADRDLRRHERRGGGRAGDGTRGARRRHAPARRRRRAVGRAGRPPLLAAPAYHGHTGAFYQDALGLWRFDGPQLQTDARPVGPPGPPGPQGDGRPAGAAGRAGSGGAAGRSRPAGRPGPRETPGRRASPARRASPGRPATRARREIRGRKVLPATPGAAGRPGAQGLQGAPGPQGGQGAVGQQGPRAAGAARGTRSDREARGAGGAHGPPGPGIGSTSSASGSSRGTHSAGDDPDRDALLQKLRGRVHRPIDAARARPFARARRLGAAPAAGRVVDGCRADPAGGAALHGKASCSASSFLWTSPRTRCSCSNALRNGGLIVIDLDCDYIFDADGNPVSGKRGRARRLEGVRAGRDLPHLDPGAGGLMALLDTLTGGFSQGGFSLDGAVGDVGTQLGGVDPGRAGARHGEPRRDRRPPRPGRSGRDRRRARGSPRRRGPRRRRPARRRRSSCGRSRACSAPPGR